MLSKTELTLSLNLPWYSLTLFVVQVVMYLKLEYKAIAIFTDTSTYQRNISCDSRFILIIQKLYSNPPNFLWTLNSPLGFEYNLGFKKERVLYSYIIREKIIICYGHYQISINIWNPTFKVFFAHVEVYEWSIKEHKLLLLSWKWTKFP